MYKYTVVDNFLISKNRAILYTGRHTVKFYTEWCTVKVCSMVYGRLEVYELALI
ncbi:hypothetical protein GRLPWR_2 [Vibrio phage GRLPWR]|nr:hypothetical protein GRLPWR_2 [Vibrio phage GRLPWR]